MKKIDARKLSCPKPVLLTKEAMLEETEIEIIVDNEAAKQNVSKFAKKMAYDVSIKEDGKFNILTLTSEKKPEVSQVENEGTEEYICNVAPSENWVLFLSTTKIGKGSDELGEVLMKSYLYTLTETKPYPEAILLMNEAVKLATDNQETIGHLKQLEENGAEILVCGTCLNYYGIQAELKAGSIDNMYSIVEKMNQAAKVIHI